MLNVATRLEFQELYIYKSTNVVDLNLNLK